MHQYQTMFRLWLHGLYLSPDRYCNHTGQLTSAIERVVCVVFNTRTPGNLYRRTHIEEISLIGAQLLLRTQKSVDTCLRVPAVDTRP